MNELAKILIFAGIVLFTAGVVALLFSKISGFGKLPGDIFIQKGNFSFYFPIVTCIIISIILTVIMNLWPKK